jgi:hypothetical protein
MWGSASGSFDRSMTLPLLLGRMAMSCTLTPGSGCHPTYTHACKHVAQEILHVRRVAGGPGICYGHESSSGCVPIVYADSRQTMVVSLPYILTDALEHGLSAIGEGASNGRHTYLFNVLHNVIHNPDAGQT